MKLVRRLLINLRIRYLLWRLRRYKGALPPEASATGATAAAAGATAAAAGAIVGELIGLRENDRTLKASSTDLQQAAKSSTSVRKTLTERKEEFGNH